MARHGAVAAGHAVTAAAAAELLEDGGNAFDAVLAALWAACVAEPVLASPGGGGFLAARSGDRARVFDFFVQTPRRRRPLEDTDFREVDVDFGGVTQAFHIGLGAAATPGFIPGLFAVHAQLGRVPMTRIVEPALRAAKEGVRITAFQAYLLGVVRPILTDDAETAALFSGAQGLLREGETMRNERLADAMDALAREGPRLATQGEIAQAMVRLSHERGGHLEPDDLRFYAPATRTPLSAIAGPWALALTPPSSTGGVLVALGLDRLAAAAGPGGLRHRVPAPDIAQTLLWMNTVREAHDGDPDALLALREGRAAEPGPVAPADRGTTHVSVVDAQGNAAAATVSNGEGCGALVPGCGFMLNNMLGEADLNPGGFNRWPENMRLSSMMTPILGTDETGRVVAMGSGGSNRIRSALLQASLLLARGLHPEEVVMHPRLHVEGVRGNPAQPVVLSYEEGWPEAECEAMVRDFDVVESWPEPNMFFGGVHMVMRDAAGGFEGAGDPRRAGVFITA